MGRGRGARVDGRRGWGLLMLVASLLGAACGDRGYEVFSVALDDWKYREEIRREFPLTAGARMVLEGLNGPVTIETTKGEVAEILVVRTARREGDLQAKELRMEQRPGELWIGNVRGQGAAFTRSPHVREQLTARIPEQVNLVARGLNGQMNVAGVIGALEVRGLNGSLDVEQADGGVEIRGTNGQVDLGLGPGLRSTPGASGPPIEIHGNNGSMTLRFAGEVHADLVAKGTNGAIDLDLPGPDGSLIGRVRPGGTVEQRLGSGGAPIELRGTNGAIRLVRMEAGRPTASR
ncbi:MAG: hypothetical protein ACOYNR_16120 [Blastocatellia bacterium]